MILLKCMVMRYSHTKNGIHYCKQHLFIDDTQSRPSFHFNDLMFYIIQKEEKSCLRWMWIESTRPDSCCTCVRVRWCYRMVKVISILCIIWVLVMTQRECRICWCSQYKSTHERVPYTTITAFVANWILWISERLPAIWKEFIDLFWTKKAEFNG